MRRGSGFVNRWCSNADAFLTPLGSSGEISVLRAFTAATRSRNGVSLPSSSVIATPVPNERRRRMTYRLSRNETHHLTSHLIEVDGRTVAYTTGGQGLPVLFIHGWGLDHRSYRRPLEQLMLRGCRIIAPSLPGFGGSTGLAGSNLSLTGHARWLARFLSEIDERKPFVVLGHSFGGGVATRLAVEHPDLVSSLVLVNSVGDPTAFDFRLGQRTARPVTFNSLPAALALISPTDEGTQVRRYSAQVVENLLRDPVAVTRTAWLARRADVRADLDALAARNLGITVLWSDRDSVIPYSAFDTFCQSFGAQGHVASGGHSWLLTEPRSFGQVLANLLAVEGERHRSDSVGATVESLSELLSMTTVPKRTMHRMLDGLSHHWLLSDSADVLAADLALCHPKLAKDEVRVVVRPIDSGAAERVTVLAADRPGLLADTTAVLANEGLSVVGASVQTWAEQGLALHSLTVVPTPFWWDSTLEPATLEPATLEPAAGERWQRVGQRLQAASTSDVSVADFQARGRVDVSVAGAGEGKSIVSITAIDRPGLLHAICRWLADHEVSVEAASVATVGSSVHDVLVVNGNLDPVAMSNDLSADQRRQRFGDAIRSALFPGASSIGC